MTVAAYCHEPLIIQGGMGIGVSNWLLAKAVSLQGQLGVVSGTALDNVLVRRLQDGDLGGHIRRALEQFPFPDISAEAIRRYFLPDGRPGNAAYASAPMFRQAASRTTAQLTMLANFVEVYLAKEGHQGRVGINYLSKVQLPTLASIYGAMLAGVDYVLMGAGIPREIPEVLDRFTAHEPAAIRFDVDESESASTEFLRFHPRDHWNGAEPPAIRRPRFLPIVSTDTLAAMLARKSSGEVNGFVVEAATAGGHNAPPRGKLTVNRRGEPVYGDRDRANMHKMRDLGLPFWLGGGQATPDGLREAVAVGATGVQVGTLFALCAESGIDPVLRDRMLRLATRDELEVLTDPKASPTGYPFKVVEMDGSLSDEAVYRDRSRVCDLGYLRTAYRRPDGRIGYRCAAEPVDGYLGKGGTEEQTIGRKCLCNALMADIGLGQRRDPEGVEPPLLTSGTDLRSVGTLVEEYGRFRAADVIQYLLGTAENRTASTPAANVDGTTTQQ